MDYNKVFYWCVDFLEFYADYFGVTYEEINVVLFCILVPALIGLEFLIIVYLLLRGK